MRSSSASREAYCIRPLLEGWITLDLGRVAAAKLRSDRKTCAEVLLLGSAVLRRCCLGTLERMERCRRWAVALPKPIGDGGLVCWSFKRDASDFELITWLICGI